MGTDFGRAAIEILALNGLIDHDKLKNYLADQHIDWTSTTRNLNTTGSLVSTGIKSREDIKLQAGKKLVFDAP